MGGEAVNRGAVVGGEAVNRGAVVSDCTEHYLH